MKKFVRDSKFRHIYASQTPKDQTYEGVIASNSRLDGNFCAVNEKFIAVVLNTSGAGVFTVLRRDKPGRYDIVPKCMGHSSEVLDLTFDPFNANRIISAAEDGTFMIWWIPDTGLEENQTETLATLKPSQRRAVQAVWHTSASDIVFLVNVDVISIYDLKNYTLVRSIDTNKYSDQIYNISLNYDSSKLAASFKDKKIRVFDIYTSELLNEVDSYDGSKPTRVQYLFKLGDYVAISGFTKMSERKIGVWDLNNPSSPVSTEDINSGVGVMNLSYDADTSLLAVFSKGESMVRIFELDNNGSIYLATVIQSGEAQKAACFGNKLACNAAQNEVLTFLKATSKGTEPMSFVVPRRSDMFQEDLFPETPGDQPAMSSEDFINGKKADPILISLKDFVATCPNTIPNKQAPISNSHKGSVSNSSRPNVTEGSSLAGRVVKLERQVEEIMQKLQMQ